VSARTKAAGLRLLLPAIALSATGDFNNDGYDDLAIGVPSESAGRLSGTGAVSALPGSAAGVTAVGDQFWSEDGAGILDTAENGDHCGNC